MATIRLSLPMPEFELLQTGGASAGVAAIVCTGQRWHGRKKAWMPCNRKLAFYTAGELDALVSAGLELSCPTCGTVTRLA